ncbi:HpaII family restriction endonuclease [Bacteroides sp. CF01-10NS]|nr:HpaII family restriction endonuclease [Bacteroides sp. CF01-10NS]
MFGVTSSVGHPLYFWKEAIGYLVVKKDGEILCYHFYDRNRFEDYLFSNAYLERSSTSRHEYASIIKENDGTLSFKLNFQVRLK